MLRVGPIRARTVRPFFPDLDACIEDIDDPRLQPQVI